MNNRRSSARILLTLSVAVVALGLGGVAQAAPGPWSSGADCAAQLRAGKKLARAGNVIRVGTWNLHGFPDGAPGKRKRGVKRTDVAWLACAIAWMQVDVVALQGVKGHWRSKKALGKLLGRLRKLTGARWKVKLDGCRGTWRDHVGLLWNTKRLSASKLGTEDSLNPYRRTCSGGQRPGYRGYFKARGGVDFGLLSVQLPLTADGGTAPRLRRRAVNGIPAAYGSMRRLTIDPDLIVAGDFAMPARPWLARAVASLSTPFFAVKANRACTVYRGGRRDAVSHFLVARDMAEVSRTQRVDVSGYCAAIGCGLRSESSLPAAFGALSPHCPVVLDVPNKDQDPPREELNRWAVRTYTTKVGKGGLPRKLSATMIKKVLRQHKRKLRRACRRAGSGAYKLTILGASGKVHKVERVEGAPKCAVRVLKRAVFPRFQVSALELLLPVQW